MCSHRMPCDRHTCTQSWQCGSAQPCQEVSPARFWAYSNVSPTTFSGSLAMPSRSTEDTCSNNCHIHGIVRPNLLIFTLGFKEFSIRSVTHSTWKNKSKTWISGNRSSKIYRSAADSETLFYHHAANSALSSAGCMVLALCESPKLP